MRLGRYLEISAVLAVAALFGVKMVAPKFIPAPNATSSPRPELPANLVREIYVESVIDGDTIVTTPPGYRTHIRLANIDAPEKDQPGGDESRQHLESLFPFVPGDENSRKAKIKVISEHDRYGRIVAELYQPDGRDVCVEQVVSGNAWVFRDYVKDPGFWIPLESYARERRLGIWGTNEFPVEPWNWRHKK